MRYQISNFQLLKQMLAAVADDDPTLPWGNYPCLEWPRGRNRKGYGRVYTPHGMQIASREAYALAYGRLPEQIDALHRCDNPPCFRPIHLFSGTDRDNMRDCVAKGRLNPARGERSGARKITDLIAEEIRRLSKQGISHRELAEKFGIGKSTIGAITTRQTWTHI